ncbi:tRNA (adenosine(37)-N6)-threonylcarbamoyltransferase complex transferase subunit TsaD [Candidatus Gracilibacteria bacterium]|nr:tRNA (adenosine(37)-N6)-threonylcarbamoyltransferase complex transferase subunit TsaD [Candidatus Gracilibacteria bacterium]
MKILAIETSCDDTSMAIFENDKLLSLDTKSQIKIHNLTSGVVPEIAAREHENAIFEVCENVLKKSNTKIEDIDYIAVTKEPGLIPSLLTGITFAKTLSNILKKPYIEINHIKGHIFSNFLERNENDITFPLVCLTVSGGHNDIYFMNSMWEIEKIGSSNDDAAGESYDKVAKMMGLEYPGGPIISKLASEYTLPALLPHHGGGEGKCLFPRVFLKKDEFDFSFSGLKSAVKREVDKRVLENGFLSDLDKKEISFEFQEAVNEVLAYKLINASIKKNTKTIMLSGGVSANDNLKEKIKKISQEKNLNFIHPIKNIYSMDNAAMIGILAYYMIKYNQI